MSDELKPCPFCGGEADIDSFIDDFIRPPRIYYLCGCKNAKCRGSLELRTYVSELEAVIAWNTMAKEVKE